MSPKTMPAIQRDRESLDAERLIRLTCEIGDFAAGMPGSPESWASPLCEDLDSHLGGALEVLGRLLPATEKPKVGLPTGASPAAQVHGLLLRMSQFVRLIRAYHRDGTNQTWLCDNDRKRILSQHGELREMLRELTKGLSHGIGATLREELRRKYRLGRFSDVHEEADE